MLSLLYCTTCLQVGGSSSTFKSDCLYEGDVVLVFHREAGKYLAIGRGYWLVWQQKAPSAADGHFVLTGLTTNSSSSSSSSASSGTACLRHSCPFQVTRNNLLSYKNVVRNAGVRVA
jgi:hypothetical protein